jgi:hypothetical protein
VGRFIRFYVAHSCVDLFIDVARLAARIDVALLRCAHCGAGPLGIVLIVIIGRLALRPKRQLEE